jgi:hypothetical protein
MTNTDIFTQILSEASGRPPAEVKGLLEQFRKMMGTKDNFDVEVPDQKAQELLRSLRTELPGIRAWLEKGGHMARIHGTMNTN